MGRELLASYTCDHCGVSNSYHSMSNLSNDPLPPGWSLVYFSAWILKDLLNPEKEPGPHKKYLCGDCFSTLKLYISFKYKGYKDMTDVLFDGLWDTLRASKLSAGTKIGEGP